MKNKFFILACILFVLMLFACAGSGDSENSENNAVQGVVTLSFAVESDDAGEKAISVNNPDFSSNLIYQYKAVADFKLADGSDPIGSTGDEWKEIKEEMSFSTGKWTFDVRVIQKGNNYESDKSDFFIHYQTEAPVKVSIDTTTAKFITFTVKKIIAGTGLIHINIAVTNQKDGKMAVNLYEIPKGGEPAIKDYISCKYDDKEKKLYFVKDLQNVPSGFYRMTIIYDDGNEEYKYTADLIEVIEGQETTVSGDIEISKPENDKEKPFVASFFGTDGKQELAGEVSMAKRLFTKTEADKKGIVLNFDGKITLVKVQQINKISNDVAKKVVVNNVEQSKKKVDNNDNKQLEQKELKPVQQLIQKEVITYHIFFDKKEIDKTQEKQYVLDAKKCEELGGNDLLTVGDHEIGVKAVISTVEAKINIIEITIEKDKE